MGYQEKYDQCVFIITGIMAAGKSTVAQLLAESFKKCVHVRGDVFRRMIVSRQVEMTPDATKEAHDQLKLRYKLTANTVDEYFKAGFHVVVQDVVIGQDLTHFISGIRNRPLYLIVLNPKAEVAAQRDRQRQKTGYKIWDPATLNNVLEKESPKIGMWLDSSELTPEETVNEILKRAKQEAEIR